MWRRIKMFFIPIRRAITVRPATSTAAQVFLLGLNPTQAKAVAQSVNATPSLGTCYTGINANPSANGPQSVTLLNRGTTITLTPPSRKPLTLTSNVGGGRYGTGPGGTATLPSGAWTFSNGAGGPDVGPLTFSFNVPQQVTWSSQTVLYTSPVVRANPFTITWSGGDANGYVDIQGFAQASTAQSGTYYVGFECTAPTSARSVYDSALHSAGHAHGCERAGENSGLHLHALPATLGSVATVSASRWMRPNSRLKSR